MISFNRYVADTDTELLDITTFLDPRVKSLPYLSEIEREMVHDRVLDDCVKMNTSTESDVNIDSETENLSTEISVCSKQGLSSLLSMYDCNAEAVNSQSSDLKMKVTGEINLYKIAPSADMNSCPLAW